jgi:hypothetical protein
MSIIYPKNLKDVEKLSAFFGPGYGKQFETVIAREPQYTYMAYLSQKGTDVPIVQVLFNNLETDPIYEYNSVGTYSLFHPLVDFTKCIISISSGQVVTPDSYRAVAYIRSQGVIDILTIDNTATPLDEQLANTMFKMEIWL